VHEWFAGGRLLVCLELDVKCGGEDDGDDAVSDEDDDGSEHEPVGPAKGQPLRVTSELDPEYDDANQGDDSCEYLGASGDEAEIA